MSAITKIFVAFIFFGLLVFNACAQPVALTTESVQKVSVPSIPGVLYEFETSADGVSWTSTSRWEIGTGETIEKYLSVPAGSQVRVNQTPLVDLNALLETLRVQTGVPALAALVIKNGKVHAMGAVGNRLTGVTSPVTASDKWHLGSLTKGMTATLAGVMVEEGLIGWESTLGEVFPEKVAAMASGWQNVTLRQLLSNTSGAHGDLSAAGIWNGLWNYEGLPRDARLFLLDSITPLALRFTPGTNYEYSNAGFSLAGAMLEKVADKDWETLMQQKLFGPLGMTDSAFGVPATPRHIDEPYGHWGTVSALVPYEPQRAADNPPAIGPSATAHATLSDMGRYMELHLKGAQNQQGLLLAPGTFDQLHTRPYGFDYALGWNALNRPALGGEVLSHTGSNTQWFANMWVAPGVDWACIVTMNFGGTEAFQKSDSVVVALMQQVGP
jgi:CubicO group peptidase (beta-lactamase class C family)